MHIRNYRNAVADVFQGRSPEPLYSGSLEQAKIIIEEAFLAASNTVRLLTHRLNPVCYGDSAVLRSSRSFFRKPGAALKILIEDESAIDTCGSLLSELKSIGLERLTVGLVPKHVRQTYSYNFLTADRKGYRYEADRIEHIAVVAGGEDNIAGTINLIRIFDALESASEPIVSRVINSVAA